MLTLPFIMTSCRIPLDVPVKYRFGEFRNSGRGVRMHERIAIGIFLIGTSWSLSCRDGLPLGRWVVEKAGLRRPLEYLGEINHKDGK